MHTEKDCNLDTVNAALKDLGLNLNITTDRNNRKRLIIDFNKEILTPINGNDGKLGRHLKKINFDAIERMKAEGMTNTQIYKRLGIAKSTYYLKLREYIKRIQSKPMSIDKTLRFTQSRGFFIIKSLYQNLYFVLIIS